VHIHSEAMVGLLDTLDELFSTRDLYEVLGFTGDDRKGASQSHLKKAYHKSSLKYHPDRVAGKSADEQSLATKKFQALGAVYKVLSDPGAKDLYDESGEVAEDDGPILDPDRDWQDYWRILFKKVTLEDVKKFEEKYRESAEEDKDLKQAYCDAEGDMGEIIDTVLCATHEDEKRFYDKIVGWIDEGSVPVFPQFKKQMTKANKSKRAKAAAKEAEEAREMRAQLNIDDNDENSLAKMIAKRQADRAQQSDAFFDQLAAKYAKPTKKKKSKQ